MAILKLQTHSQTVYDGVNRRKRAEQPPRQRGSDDKDLVGLGRGEAQHRARDYEARVCLAACPQMSKH